MAHVCLDQKETQRNSYNFSSFVIIMHDGNLPLDVPRDHQIMFTTDFCQIARLLDLTPLADLKIRFLMPFVKCLKPYLILLPYIHPGAFI